MERYLDRALLACFPAVVVLVAAHAVGVPYARYGAILAILFGAACLGFERLVGERTTLDLVAGVVLPAGAIAGAVVAVVTNDPALAFLPPAPGIVALYAARRELPVGTWPSVLDRSG